MCSTTNRDECSGVGPSGWGNPQSFKTAEMVGIIFLIMKI
nr:MAG TPA: hypothetical protein [Caudoviricetes sp.]